MHAKKIIDIEMNAQTDPVREKVITVASKMFVTQGCKTVTMDDIAKKMHISKRTLYEKFGDKENLLGECTAYLVQSDKALVQPLFSAQTFDEFFELMESLIIQHNLIFDIHQHYGEELQRYYPGVFKKHLLMHSKERLESIKTALRSFKEKNIIRNDVDINIASVFINEISQQIIFDHFSIVNYKSNELLSNFLTVYFRGLVSRDFSDQWELLKEKCEKNKE